MNDPFVPSGGVSGDGETVVPFKDVEAPSAEPEVRENDGPDAQWTFWNQQLSSALVNERRWRNEAQFAERLYFGPDEDPGRDADEARAPSVLISDDVALIHANIEVLKPMLFSETPQPIVRRRYHGDGGGDETDLIAAEAGQRMATWLLDTEPFDEVMKQVRDDWLIAGRGAGRVRYEATFKDQAGQMAEQIGPDGLPVLVPGEPVKVKTQESVCPIGVEWRRFLTGPSSGWRTMPWLAFEVPMTRGAIERRWGKDVAGAMSYNLPGIEKTAVSDSDRTGRITIFRDSDTGTRPVSVFDTAPVWEIWTKEGKRVIWWSNAYKQGTIEEIDDPLQLKGFWPMPKPLLASVKGDTLTPRPDIMYYARRAEEVRIATEKLNGILKALSVSGLIPAGITDDVKKLLDGDSKIIAIQSWMALMEKGGLANAIQWLPIEAMVSAANALVLLREQAKQQMFEASGVSDVMRAQGDPTETATAQRMKGQYAGLRLADKQRAMAIYAREMLKIMLEIAFEMFDTDRLAKICGGLKIPLTEAERAQMQAANDAAQAQYEQAMQQGALMEQAGMPVPPPPPPPELPEVPGTSWELVHDRLRSDFGREITLSIETQSTVLVDEKEDRAARVEFLESFVGMAQSLTPLAGSGAIDMKTVKELLLFGVRGFPKSRTLESMIAALPDEPKGPAPDDVAVQVAKIRAEVDKLIKEMDMQDSELDRQHEVKMKGVELLAEAERMKAEPGPELPQVPMMEGAQG